MIPVIPGALVGLKVLMNSAISEACICFVMLSFSSFVTCFIGKSTNSLRFFSFEIFF